MKLKKLIMTGFSLALGIAGFAGTANAATKTPIMNGPQVITKTVKVGKVTIPANTRVSVSGLTKKGNKQYVSVALDNLTYQLRHVTKATSITVRVNHNFKPSKYTAMDQLSRMTKGKTFSSEASFHEAPTMMFTDNKYVEYFSSGNVNKKPLSSTKITKVRKSGNTTYLYAKKNMLKLPDKRVSKKGNYQYRLAIHYNGAKEDGIFPYASYSVGSTYFYTPTGKA